MDTFFLPHQVGEITFPKMEDAKLPITIWYGRGRILVPIAEGRGVDYSRKIKGLV